MLLRRRSHFKLQVETAAKRQERSLWRSSQCLSIGWWRTCRSARERKIVQRERERERGKSVCSGPTLPTHCYKLRNESTSWAGSSKAWPLARQNLSPPLISAHVVNHNGYGNGPAASLYWSWCVCYQKDFGIRGNQLKKRFLISIIEIPSWRMVELSCSWKWKPLDEWPGRVT